MSDTAQYEIKNRTITAEKNIEGDIYAVLEIYHSNGQYGASVARRKKKMANI